MESLKLQFEPVAAQKNEALEISKPLVMEVDEIKRRIDEIGLEKSRAAVSEGFFNDHSFLPLNSKRKTMQELSITKPKAWSRTGKERRKGL